MKYCYTAIIGNYEELKEPTIVSKNWTYVCFTDQELTSDIWEIRKVETNGLDPQRLARCIKLLPHEYLPEAEFTFWIDAAFQINLDLNIFWDKYFRSPFTCPSHPIRNCVYREIASCISNKRGDAEELNKQEQSYKKEKIPEFGGIITSGVLMRQQTVGCINMCNEWWEELSKHSARDQVAFAKISRGWRFHTFAWDYSQSRDLKYIKHFKHRH